MKDFLKKLHKIMIEHDVYFEIGEYDDETTFVFRQSGTIDDIFMTDISYINPNDVLNEIGILERLKK